VNSGSGADRALVVSLLVCEAAGGEAGAAARVVLVEGCAGLLWACVGGPLTDTVFVDEPHAFRLARVPPRSSAAVNVFAKRIVVMVFALPISPLPLALLAGGIHVVELACRNAGSHVYT